MYYSRKFEGNTPPLRESQRFQLGIPFDEAQVDQSRLPTNVLALPNVTVNLLNLIVLQN